MFETFRERKQESLTLIMSKYKKVKELGYETALSSELREQTR